MSFSVDSIAFVLVPGSFSPASYYDRLVPLLEEKGYTVNPTELKSVNNGDGHVVTMYEDAEQINLVISKLVDEGKLVVLVVNSYGGIPGTQAAKGLSKAERSSAGKPGALVEIVYLSSFVAPEGSCINRIMAGRMPQNTQASSDYLSMNPKTDGEYIFSHLNAADKTEYASRLKKHSRRTFDDCLTYPGYLHVPVTYLVSTDDIVIPPELQHQMVDAAIAKGAKITRKEIYSDHCPMISHPEEVVQVLLEVAEREHKLMRL